MQKQFNDYSEREFLITNGIGGYCSSSYCCANTRRYHGLLIASFNPPTQRMVLVSGVEEKLKLNDQEFNLSTNQYPGTVYPEGYHFIERVENGNNSVTFFYQGEGWRLEKKISMLTGKNTTVIEYRNTGESEIELTLSPLLVYRDYHALFCEAPEFDFFVERINGPACKVYARYQAAPLYIYSNIGNWEFKNTWNKNVEYEREKERGFDFKEDVVNIGGVTASILSNEIVQLVFSTEETAVIDTDPEIPDGIIHARDLPAFVNDLVNSSEQFLVTRKSTNGYTLLAGYHWFTDWGRDTMIAMRGSVIANGKQEEAKSILRTFCQYIDRGMLPNRFPDYENDVPEYNTIDAALWLFVSLHDYHSAFSDEPFIREIFAALGQVIEWHITGTRYNIRVNEKGLLYGGEPGVQLTWMDAKVGDFVVTPRIGCPVEINLLWYNAMLIYRHFADELNVPDAIDLTMNIALFEDSFEKYFFNKKGYLNDVVIPDVYVDDSIRPNMIYVLSLPYSPLPETWQKRILDLVEKELLTPFGLRTLNSENPDFKPIYEGDAWHRDTAYHQGTVWPFLWGEWAIAFLKTNGFCAEACKRVWDHSANLQEHFYQKGCSHSIAEIYDGLIQGISKGCVHQAWSVGNMLMVFLHKEFKWNKIL